MLKPSKAPRHCAWKTCEQLSSAAPARSGLRRCGGGVDAGRGSGQYAATEQYRAGRDALERVEADGALVFVPSACLCISEGRWREVGATRGASAPHLVIDGDPVVALLGEGVCCDAHSHEQCQNGSCTDANKGGGIVPCSVSGPLGSWKMRRLMRIDRSNSANSASIESSRCCMAAMRRCADCPTLAHE